MIDISKPHWLAAYTRPRSEKKVLERLVEDNVEAYLPLRRTLKQWSDRKKWIEEPLLRSYIFVRIAQKEREKVIKTFGMVCYVSFEGSPVPIPDKQIEALRLFVEQKKNIIVSDDQYEPGELVEVVEGPLKGLVAEVIKVKGKRRLLLRIDAIKSCFLSTIPKGCVVKKLKVKE